MREIDRQEPVTTEVAISAVDIDLVEVAKVSGGTVSFDKNKQPKVTWGVEEGPAEMEWMKVAQEDEAFKDLGKSLRFWRGDSVQMGGPGNEIAGAVMGENFFALVQPTRSMLYTTQKGILIAEVMAGGKRYEVFGPEAMFAPAFRQARDIADKNVEEFLKVRPTMGKYLI
jgi:hypothetical protein